MSISAGSPTTTAGKCCGSATRAIPWVGRQLRRDPGFPAGRGSPGWSQCRPLARYGKSSPTLPKVTNVQPGHTVTAGTAWGTTSRPAGRVMCSGARAPDPGRCWRRPPSPKRRWLRWRLRRPGRLEIPGWGWAPGAGTGRLHPGPVLAGHRRRRGGPEPGGHPRRHQRCRQRPQKAPGNPSRVPHGCSPASPENRRPRAPGATYPEGLPARLIQPIGLPSSQASPGTGLAGQGGSLGGQNGTARAPWRR